MSDTWMLYVLALQRQSQSQVGNRNVLHPAYPQFQMGYRYILTYTVVYIYINKCIYIYYKHVCLIIYIWIN